MTDKPVVRTTCCSHRADDAEVVKAVVDLLNGLRPRLSWLSTARSIMVKTNIGATDFRQHHGRPIAITDPAVVEGVVAFLRQHTDAAILVAEASTGEDTMTVFDLLGYPQRLAEYDVRMVDLNRPPFAEYTVPQGGTIFRSYTLSAEFQSVDAFISVSKLKSHLSTGATVTLKNLFGIPPVPVYGNPRRYVHAFVRLPRTVVDMALILKPVLGVVDALISADRREWQGPAVETNLLLAGDNLVATDATAMRFMGMDPTDTYPHAPYILDHQPVLLSAQAGLGPVSADEIEVDGVQPVRLFDFDIDRHWEPDVVQAVRRSTAEQALLYQREREQFREQHENQYVCIGDGEVIWEGENLASLPRRGELASKLYGVSSGLFLKRVGPASEDPEHYERYEEVLNGQ